MADEKLSEIYASSPAGPITGAELIEMTQDGGTVAGPVSMLLAVAAAAAEDAIDDAIAALAPAPFSIGIPYLADTSSTTDADPGAGKLRWNNASQSAATVLFLDDVTSGGANLTGIWAALASGGFVYAQNPDDHDVWSINLCSAVVDATGYAKLTITRLAGDGSFANGDPMLVTLEQGYTPTSFSGGALTSALNEAKATNIASASTTDIGAATGNLVHVTGTTTITALGTVQAGTARTVVFDGALTLTHNATSLILPTGANIVTAAGDAAQFRSEGSGNWRCVGYMRASGVALVASSPAPVIVTTVSSNTITPTSTTDEVRPASLTAGLTIANPTGTPVDGWGFVVELVDNGSARSLTWGSDFATYMATLPTTTTAGKVHRIGFEWNAAAAKWRCMFAQVQP